MSNKDSDELDNIIGELCGNPQTAEQDEQIHQAKQALLKWRDKHSHQRERDLLRAINLYGTPQCQSLHHPKNYHHSGFEECPVEKEIIQLAQTKSGEDK